MLAKHLPTRLMAPYHVCMYLQPQLIYQILKAHALLLGLNYVLTEDLSVIKGLPHSRKDLWGCSILFLMNLKSIHVLAHQCLI